MDGLLNLNKPVGPTSFQMIGRLRRLTGIQKIGHAGTLDPLASGVLLICLGKAVRLSEYLMSDDKVYVAEVTFGVRTTTDDAEGEIVAQQSVDLAREQLERVLSEFVGEQEQVPPQFAAIKIAGRPMYKLARRGEVVETAPRRITIKALKLLDWQSPRARIEVACSKGTYIRALARDLGERLGCGAYLSALTRTQSGAFKLADAVSLETLQNADWQEYLLPMDYGLQHWPAVYLDEAETRRILHGLSVKRPDNSSAPTLVRAYDPAGRFVAVLRFAPTAQELRPEKVLSEP